MELFNEHYLNIVERSSGKKPLSLGNSSDAFQDEMTVKEIVSVYSNHPSIRKIKNLCVPENTFDLPYASTSDINKIIKSLNVNKAKKPDGISAKSVKMSANVIDCHLASIINNDISSNKFSKHVKTSTVRPIFKKDDRANIKNYCPVSLLNIFLKTYERFLHENLTSYVEIFLSKLFSAYCKSYILNHVLIGLIENLKKSLDQKKFLGTVLMDLSKAFDSIPHDLLIAKIHAYGFSLDAVTFFYSYLKRRRQNMRINNTHSVFQILFPGFLKYLDHFYSTCLLTTYISGYQKQTC